MHCTDFVKFCKSSFIGHKELIYEIFKLFLVFYSRVAILSRVINLKIYFLNNWGNFVNLSVRARSYISQHRQ